jgi:hypothetical protein
MNPDAPTDDNSLDEILSLLDTFETVTPCDSQRAAVLKTATASLVHALARAIESHAIVLESRSGRSAEKAPRCVSVDDLVLRFGRAAIRRMAASREPNKAFGWLRSRPGNTGELEVARHKAWRFGAAVALECRRGRGLVAAIDLAAGRFGVSPSTIRSYLKRLADDYGRTEISSGLSGAFQNFTDEELRELAHCGDDP